MILKVTFQMGVGTGQGQGSECPTSLVPAVPSQARCWRDQGSGHHNPWGVWAGELSLLWERGCVQKLLCRVGWCPTRQGGQGPPKLSHAQHRAAKLHLELLLHLGSFRDEPHQCRH